MLLAINIGNTNISFALFKGQKIRAYWDTPLRDYSKSILSSALSGNKISAALICSVVPGLSGKLIKHIRSLTGIKALVIGKDIRVPIKTVYQYSQLGVDRRVNIYAVSRVYRAPAIIVSCGTALTIDVISKDMLHLGGLIIPGLQLSLTALNLGTAQLPSIKLKSPVGILGKNTKTSMLNGVILGTSASISSLIKKIMLKTGSKTRVVGTGGGISLVNRFAPEIKTTDKKITLKGIALLYESTNKND
jgi:type III pantothenate kinase